MRRLWVALLVVTSCGTASAPVAHVSPLTAQATTSPSAQTTAASPVLGVFYDSAAAELALVDSNGNLTTSTRTTAPHRYSQGLPWTSATLKRLYYLTPTGDVQDLQRDGTAGRATPIALATGEEAGFSVSPDDAKVAVAILRYRPGSTAPTFLGTRMYVEDVSGSGHHVEIYSSTINAEYPIAWTTGHLVVALTTPVCCRAGVLNPYGALEYHVADPATGKRLVTLCHGGLGPLAPPTTVGVTCAYARPNPFAYLHWDGSSCCDVGTAPIGALSPDGNAVAGGEPAPIGIEISSHGPHMDVTGIVGDLAGWLDLTHLVYRAESDSALHIGLLPSLVGPVVPLNGPPTTFEGTLPTAIS